MSRIGNKPIDIPKGVEVKLDGNVVSVKGPLGSLKQEMHNEMILKIEEDKLVVERP